MHCRQADVVTLEIRGRIVSQRPQRDPCQGCAGNRAIRQCRYTAWYIVVIEQQLVIREISMTLVARVSALENHFRRCIGPPLQCTLGGAAVIGALLNLRADAIGPKETWIVYAVTVRVYGMGTHPSVRGKAVAGGIDTCVSEVEKGSERTIRECF